MCSYVVQAYGYFVKHFRIAMRRKWEMEDQSENVRYILIFIFAKEAKELQKHIEKYAPYTELITKLVCEISFWKFLNESLTAFG